MMILYLLLALATAIWAWYGFQISDIYDQPPREPQRSINALIIGVFWPAYVLLAGLYLIREGIVCGVDMILYLMDPRD